MSEETSGQEEGLWELEIGGRRDTEGRQCWGHGASTLGTQRTEELEWDDGEQYLWPRLWVRSMSKAARIVRGKLLT